jgi:hypothetical protein
MPQRGRPQPRQLETEPQLAESSGPTLHENLPIIEVTESWLLDSLLKDTQANRMIIMRLDDRTAIIMPNQYDNVVARLRKLGHTPRLLER